MTDCDDVIIKSKVTIIVFYTSKFWDTVHFVPFCLCELSNASIVITVRK